MKPNTKVQVFNHKQELIADGRVVSITSTGCYIQGEMERVKFGPEWFPLLVTH